MGIIYMNGLETGSQNTFDWVDLGNQPGISLSIIDTPTAGPWSRKALQLYASTGSSPAAGITISGTYTDLYFAFWWSPQSISGSGPIRVCRFLEPGGTVQNGFWMTNTGRIRAYRGDATTQLQESTATFSFDKYHFVEARVNVDDASGVMTFYVDGTEFINFTGDTKQHASVATLAMWRLESPSSEDAKVNRFDDITISDDGYPGEYGIQALSPMDDGDVIQWTPGRTTFQRVYFPSTGTPEVSPAFASGWERTSEAFRRSLTPDKMATALTDTSSTNVSWAANDDLLIGQWVSAPLASQTISGDVKGQFQAREQTGSVDGRSQIVIRVVSQDGLTNRGTLLDFDTRPLSSEWPTTKQNRRFPRLNTILYRDAVIPTALGDTTAGLPPEMEDELFSLAVPQPVTMSPVFALDGDRIIVEVGFRAHSGNSGAYGLIRVGDAGASDLPEDEGSASDSNGWVEFSNAITLLAENWPKVDEQPDIASDEDVQYVSEATANERDLYVFEDVGAGWTDVKAVCLWMRVKEVEAGAAKIAGVVKSWSTVPYADVVVPTALGDTATGLPPEMEDELFTNGGGMSGENTGSDVALSPAYDWVPRVMAVDPTDSTAWTRTKLNALQAGPKAR